MAQGTCSIEGCGRAVHARSWCATHYSRWQTHGSPLVVLQHKRRHVDIQAVLEAGAHPTTDDCILLMPGQGDARPRLRRGGRRTNASRLAWTLAYGDPGSLHVLHRCNGGSGEHGCINVRHLYLGSDQDNANDRGRSGHHLRGAKVWSAKLNEHDVRNIRALHAAGNISLTELAEIFPVTVATLSSLVRRKTWKHV